jgi:hypothetical protein
LQHGPLGHVLGSKELKTQEISQQQLRNRYRCISHAIVMTDALNIYDGILKLKKMVLQRRAA